MQRSILFFVSLCIFFTMATSCGKKTELTRVAFINFIGGSVSIIEGNVKTPAKLGAEIKEGLGIETGTKSFAEIAIGENIIKVMENTLVQVTQLSINADKGEDSMFFVKQGQMISRISKKLGKTDSFVINTPTSVASVRGTDFAVSEEANKSYIACIDGKVEIRKADGSVEIVDLNAGQEIYVEPDKPLSVQDLSELNRKNYTDILNEISAIQADIRQRFEEEREMIREKVREQKEQNREMVDKQRTEDKQRVEDQKAADKANVRGAAGKENVDAVAGSSNVKAGSEEAKKNVDSVKPDINKFKSDLKK